jgi:hypothetical protein
VNLCFSWVTAIAAWLYGQNPLVQVEPRQGQDRAFAEALEHWLEYSAEETDTRTPNEVVIFDAILRGMAWSKELWDPSRRIDTTDALTPLEVYVDPVARFTLGQARFMLQRVVRPVDEARALTGNPALEPNYELSREEGLASRGKESHQASEKDLFLCYEIWSKEPGGRRMLYYRDREKAAFCGEPRPWPYLMDRDDFPYSLLRFNTQHTDLTGFSDQVVIEGLRQTTEEVSEFDRRHVLRSAAKAVLYDSSKITEDQIEKILSAKDMQATAVEGLANYKTEQLIRIVDWNSATDDQKELFQRAKALHDEILGFDELLRAGTQVKLTATQADIVAEFARLRLGRRTTCVDRWLERQTRHRAQIARLYVTPEQIAKAAGPESAMAWAQYAGNADDLVGEYSIGIQAGSSGERAQAQRTKEAQDTFSLLAQAAPLLAQVGTPVDLKEAVLEIFRARRVRNPERFFPAPPPPPPAVAPQGMPAPQPQPGTPQAAAGMPAPNMGAGPGQAGPPEAMPMPPELAQGMENAA